MPDHWVAMPDHRVAMPVHMTMPYHHFNRRNKKNIQLAHYRAAMPDRVALPGQV